VVVQNLRGRAEDLGLPRRTRRSARQVVAEVIGEGGASAAMLPNPARGEGVGAQRFEPGSSIRSFRMPPSGRPRLETRLLVRLPEVIAPGLICAVSPSVCMAALLFRQTRLPRWSNG